MITHYLGGKILRSYIISTVSIALVLFLLGAVSYVMFCVYQQSEKLGNSVTMIAELRDGLSDEEQNALSALLREEPMVENVKFVSKEEKMADDQFRKVFLTDVIDKLEDNPLPDSFDIILSDESRDSVQLAKFVNRLSKREEITFVSYPEEVIRTMHSVINRLQTILLIFGGSLLLIAIILLRGTIRLAILSRREQITAMKIAGATRWYIIKPFLARSIVQGLFAGLMAAALLYGALAGMDMQIPELGISLEDYTILLIVAGMILFGMAISVFCTLFTMLRIMSFSLNRLQTY
ncbi:MAG: permease-like cell division protein FtsX [Alistipes sp.]|nr:permease-like cell division protein FtsX [Candidatus Alistipes equi]